MKKIFFLFLPFLISQKLLATIYFAKPTATGSGNGLSWANATTVANALNIAANGDEIWVMAGTHYPTMDENFSSSPADGRNKTFFLKAGVKLYGGFAGTETAFNQRLTNVIGGGANATILSGDIGTINNATDNSYHVVIIAGQSSTTTIDGFTISNGNANGSGAIAISGKPIYNSTGGGMIIEGIGTGTNPTISNCIFSNNQCSDSGSGIYMSSMNGNAANPVFNACVFTANATNRVIRNSNFGTNNTVTYNNTIFYNNSTTYIQNDVGGSTNTATNNYNNCNFIHSTTSTIAISNVRNSATLVNNFLNCVFNDLVYSTDNGTTVTNNNTTTISNAANTAFGNINNADGADNIWGTNDDGLLQPCGGLLQDAGTSAGAPTTDIRGNSRPKGTTADVGAYEQGNNTTATIAIITGTMPLCNSGSLSFTVTPTNPGVSPTYQWTKNNTNISGANTTTYTGSSGTDFVNGDVIRCVLTSSDACASPAVATSNAITIAINAPATRLYVKANATGTNDGSSWTNAYTNLQYLPCRQCRNLGSSRYIQANQYHR
jgi:hypothetical protein